MLLDEAGFAGADTVRQVGVGAPVPLIGRGDCGGALGLRRLVLQERTERSELDLAVVPDQKQAFFAQGAQDPLQRACVSSDSCGERLWVRGSRCERIRNPEPRDGADRRADLIAADQTGHLPLQTVDPDDEAQIDQRLAELGNVDLLSGLVQHPFSGIFN